MPIKVTTKYTFVRVIMEVGRMVRVTAIAPDGTKTVTHYQVQATKKQFARLVSPDGSILEIKT